MEIVRRITAERLKHSELERLLNHKGLSSNSDYGWNWTLKRLNKLTPTKPKEVEIVFFRPTEEEWKPFTSSEPEAYAARGLNPASLFEILAVLPDDDCGIDRHKPFCEMLGGDFGLYVHGHFSTSWHSRSYPLVSGRYGWKLEVQMDSIALRHSSWYAGFRKPQ